jgi:hypothetical protein
VGKPRFVVGMCARVVFCKETCALCVQERKWLGDVVKIIDYIGLGVFRKPVYRVTGRDEEMCETQLEHVPSPYDTFDFEPRWQF